MKAIIKILIAIALANALYQASTAYISFYRFKDSVDELVTHTAGRSDGQLKDRVAELAATYGEPVDGDAVDVRHDQNHLYIDMSYTKPVALFPGYVYEWPFRIDADGLLINPTKLDDLTNPK